INQGARHDLIACKPDLFDPGCHELIGARMFAGAPCQVILANLTTPARHQIWCKQKSEIRRKQQGQTDVPACQAKRGVS
ncbi:MAG: hypothetical protein ACRD3W_25945, partial [Terriglobales bacterium]